MTTSIDDDTLLAIGRFFRAVDCRDWDAVVGLLADKVSVDYTSVFGGEPETVSGPELVTRWKGLLPGFDATQHFLAQLLPGGDGQLECNVRGHHYLDGEEWMVAGWYQLTVTGGRDDQPVRLSGITITRSHETGSRDLLTRAQERAAA